MNYRRSENGDPAPDGSMEAQLRSLYADRERLHRALGTADPDAIIAMVRSLEAQLLDLYTDRDERLKKRDG